MKAGEPSQNIAAARDKVYAKYGQSAEGVLAYTAHGIGVDSLEPPWVPGKDRIMQEGMMINLHPAIKFDDPEVGGALGGCPTILLPTLTSHSGGRHLTPFPILPGWPGE